MNQLEEIYNQWKPGDFTTPKILADIHDELDMHTSAIMLRSGIYLVRDGYGDDGDGDGYGGGGNGGGDGGGGNGYGGGGGYGYILSQGFIMKNGDNGICIICCPGGYYPYVRIGWCFRVDDMIEIYSCRVIKNFGNLAELSVIAEEGPKNTTKLLTASKHPEDTSTALVARRIICNIKAWENHCPKPKNYPT